MKKEFLICLFALSSCFISCNGNSNNKESGSLNEEFTEMAPNEVKPFKIENNQIIPTNGKPAIIDFSATWCPPCQKLKPIFNKLEEDFHDRINFITIDVDENQELAQSYGVQNIPYLVFVNKDGQIQNTIVGFQDRDQLLASINTYFGF